MNEAELLHELASEDQEQRRRAVVTLGDDVTQPAPVALMMALSDPEWRVRKEAVRVAREQAVTIGLLPKLVEAICQGENVGLRNAALDVLEALGGDAAGVLVAALPTVPSETKKFVIEALACGGDPRVVTTLVESSHGEDVMTAVTAIEALSTIGGPAVERALRDHLSSDEALIRMATLDGLNRLEVLLEWEQLQPLLADRMTRRVVTVALGRCGRPQAVAPLVIALSERSVHLVRAAATSLARLARTSPELSQAVEVGLRRVSDNTRGRIRELAADIDQAAREAAAELLVAARDPMCIGEVVELAASDMLSPSAQEGLRRWGRPLVELLLSWAEGADDRRQGTALELVSDAAIPCIGGVHPGEVELVQQVRVALRRGLAGDSPNLKLSAARCMGPWAQAQDATLLVETATTEGEDVAYACGRALSELARTEHAEVDRVTRDISLEGPAGAPLTALIASLGGPDVVARLQRALSAQEPRTRRAAIEGLASIPDPVVPELIVFALADESVDVQMTAARALGSLRDADGSAIGMEMLMLALGSEVDGVRASAARALGATGDRRSVAPLRDLISRGSASVVLAAIEGLRALGDTDVDDLLTEALKHDDEEVVKQALYAVADARGARCVATLSEALDHHAWDVRRLAAELLGGLGDRSARAALLVQRDREMDDLALEAVERALTTLGAE